jgi:hypothetical protein
MYIYSTFPWCIILNSTIVFKRFIVLLFLALSNLGFAQQPSHYFIGEEELAGIDLYSVTQSSDGMFWLTSNQGVIKYDGHNFTKIRSENAKSHSLFEIKKDENNDLYCINLSGEIFRVYEDSLELFYQIPDSLLSSYLFFNFDGQNNLIFSSKGYYKVQDNGQIQKLFSSPRSNPITKLPTGELFFSNIWFKEIAFYKNDSIEQVESLPFVANACYTTSKRVLLGNDKTHRTNIYEKIGENWSILDFENKSNLEKGSNVEFRIVHDSLFAFTYKERGIFLYNQKGNLKYGEKKLFPQHRISGSYFDQEGSLWLITLGKGIIVIPNPEIIDFNNIPQVKNADIRSVIIKDNRVLIGGLDGSVFEIKENNVQKIAKIPSAIEFLDFDVKRNILFLGNQISKSNNPAKEIYGVSSVKDLVISDSNTYFFATNWGIVKVIIDNKGKNTSEFINKVRTRCVYHHKEQNYFLVGTSKGLQFINSSKKYYITYKGNPITVRDIFRVEDEIWLSTSSHGILIYRNNQLDPFSFTKELNIKDVNKCIYKKGILFFTSNVGIYIYNFKENSHILLTKGQGLLSNKIIDFDVKDHHLWLVFTQGLQKINYKNIQFNKTTPNFMWKSISVNKTIINPQEKNEFSYQENQFSFQFLALAYKHRGRLTYQYILEGLHSDWRKKEFQNNQVDYQSLPHGEYTFKVKAINEDGVESNTLKYAFSISPPFWFTWWFYLSVVVVISLLVATYFVIRLQIVRKQLTLEKQLKTSEITAIKAQMHPHFVFNALNSIQDLILLKDIRNSNLYLGKFADLMRKTLEFSSQNFISLKEEIEILQLYLELEKLRFVEDLFAEIQCDLSEEELFGRSIPSMLIQPYVENAIKHGLLHKQGGKTLIVHFYMEEEVLVCEVVDNGIGRKKSEEIQLRRSKSYQSFSTKANKKRIDLIKESSNVRIDLNITDLYKDSEPCGTKVEFRFY